MFKKKWLFVILPLLFLTGITNFAHADYRRSETVNRKIDVYKDYVKRNKQVSDLVTFLNNNLDKEYEILFSQDVITLDANASIPTNAVTVSFERGGAVTGNYTLTFNDNFIKAAPFRIFGEDLVVTGSAVNTAIYAEWFGAVANDLLPDSSYIQNQIDFAIASQKTAMMLDGVYLFDTTVNVTTGVELKGTGKFSSADSVTLGNGVKSTRFKQSADVIMVDVSGTSINLGGPQVFGFNCSGIIFDGNEQAYDSPGLRIRAVAHTTFKQLIFRKFKGNAFYALEWFDSVIKDSFFVNNSTEAAGQATAILASGADGYEFTNNIRMNNVTFETFEYTALLVTGNNTNKIDIFQSKFEGLQRNGNFIEVDDNAKIIKIRDSIFGIRGTTAGNISEVIKMTNADGVLIDSISLEWTGAGGAVPSPGVNCASLDTFILLDGTEEANVDFYALPCEGMTSDYVVSVNNVSDLSKVRIKGFIDGATSTKAVSNVQDVYFDQTIRLNVIGDGIGTSKEPGIILAREDIPTPSTWAIGRIVQQGDSDSFRFLKDEEATLEIRDDYDVRVSTGNLEVRKPGNGVTIYSPDGNDWKITVDNAGTVVVTDI